MWTTLPPPVHSASGRVEICTTTSGLDPALTDGGCGRVPLKLSPDRPSPTIQAQPGPNVGPFHWENRRLRVPELRRLFTFPDDFTFVGRRSSVQAQIGNAVPPLLACQVAGCVAQVVR